jgi:hypothetical protein
MPEKTPRDSPLRELFRRALEKAFGEFRALYSPGVARHLANDVLGDFIHVDHVYRLRSLEGRRLDELPEMLEVSAGKEGPERTLEVDGYIGDFALFMASFFPSSLRKRRWGVPTPMVSRVGQLLVSFKEPLDYYAAEGRNAYERAAETARLFSPDDCAVYSPLCRHFKGYLELLQRVKSLIRDLPELRQVQGFLH